MIPQGLEPLEWLEESGGADWRLCCEWSSGTSQRPRRLQECAKVRSVIFQMETRTPGLWTEGHPHYTMTKTLIAFC